MGTDLMGQFQQAYKDFNLSALLEPEDIERFRVDYGLETLIRLRKEIEASEIDGKFIFSGHRGCGKSTLLKRLSVELKSKYHVVLISVADVIEHPAISHVNILYVIALRLISSAHRLRLEIPNDIITTVLCWNQQISQTQGVETTQGIEVEANLQIITLKLQREKLFRDELETCFAKRLSDLVEKIDRLADTIRTQTKDRKPVVVIIDDLDKLDLPLVEEIYQKNIKSLFSPAIRIVFTIPVSAIQEPKIMGAINSAGVVRPYTFPVAKFFPKDDRHSLDIQPLEKPLNVFLKMVNLRISEDLIELETAKNMILKSGGLLRELVRLGRECCTECMVQLEINPDLTDLKINQAILETAIRNIRNDFSRQISAKSYEILSRVYQEGEPIDNSDPEFVKLLHGLIILEYENDSLWYDVHPIAVDLLRQKQIIV